MARKGLFAALEDLGTDGVVETNMAESELQSEVSVNELTSDSSEVEDTGVAIEEATDAAENIEAISEVAEQSIEGGEGMSPEAAEIAEISVESICTRLGMRYKRRTVPSLESFGQKQSRLSATKIAIEGFGDKVSEIWKKIIEGVKFLAKKIQDFFFNLFNSVESMEKLVKSVSEEAGKIKADAKKKEEKMKSNLASILGNDVGTVLKNQTANIGQLKTLETEVNKYVMSITDTAKSKADAASIKTDIVTTIKKVADIAPSFKPLYAGSMLKMTQEEVVVKVSFEGEAGKETEINFLEVVKIKEICSDATGVVAAVKSSKSVAEAAAKANKDLISALEKAAKELGEEKDSKEIAGIVRKSATSVTNANAQVISRVLTDSFRNVKAAMSLCTSSIKNLA